MEFNHQSLIVDCAFPPMIYENVKCENIRHKDTITAHSHGESKAMPYSTRRDGGGMLSHAPSDTLRASGK